MKRTNVIPIVFAANNEYTPYTGVAISSVILNSSRDFNYHIYVLNRNISDENVKRLESLGNDYISVKCVNVSEQIRDISDFHSLHLTQECIYRLLIPDLFGQYEKVVYLDSDLIVVGDIAEFYQNNIDGYLLGAVHDIYTIPFEQYYRNNLGLSALNAFNDGVLLMNVPLLRQKNIKKQCLYLLEEDAKKEHPKYTFLDQDVLNLTCRGNVLFLNNEWNFQSIHLRPELMKDFFTEYKESYLKAEKGCKIIHYSSPEKPWRDSLQRVSKSEEFWKIAKQTIFYTELWQQYKISENQLELDVPLCNIKKGFRIVLYGAGVMGNRLWNILSSRKYCQIVLWVDRNAAELSKSNKEVCSIGEISKAEYDQIVIAVCSEAIANSITKYLQDQGIPGEKIAWAYRPKESHL